MLSSDEQNQHQHDQHDECPQCRQKYEDSSSDQSTPQRLIIPIRKDLLTKQNTHIETMLTKLQVEVQNLKKSNQDKDKQIEDLKKEMEHKMTHYALYGELSKQADEISRLRAEITMGKSVAYSRDNYNYVETERVRGSRREQNKQADAWVKPMGNRALSESERLQRKIHSTYQNYNTLRQQFLKDKNKHKSKHKHKQQNQQANQYFSTATPVFKISQAKNKIQQLQSRLRSYEKQLRWMTNFVTTFINTMQTVALSKYQEQILAPEWGLRKKAKTSWRYLKHLFAYIYREGS